MVDFFQKKINSLRNSKKDRVVRSLPKPYVCRRVLVDKKTTRMICRPNAFYVKMAMWFLGAVFVATTIYVTFFSQLLIVTAIEIKGNEKLANDDIAEMAREKLRGEIFGFLQKNNLVMIDTDEIERSLLDRYRRIKKVAVYKKFPNTIVIELEERPIRLVYCSAGECFVIDGDGIACARADFEKNELGEQGLTIVNDESGKMIQEKDFFMQIVFIQFILEIEKQLSVEGIEVNKKFSTPVLVSGDVRVETAAGWRIFFNLQTGAENGVKMLKTVIKNNLQDDQLSNLEYVDVRLPNKIYYKLKTSMQEGGSPEQEVSANDSSEDSTKDKKKKK
jgi:cell division septal protein FtsQ